MVSSPATARTTPPPSWSRDRAAAARRDQVLDAGDQQLPLRAERLECHLLHVDLPFRGKRPQPDLVGVEQLGQAVHRRSLREFQPRLTSARRLSHRPGRVQHQQYARRFGQVDPAARTAASTGGLGGDSVTPTSSAR